MVRDGVKLALIVVATVLIGGCATIVGGRYQKIQMNGFPEGTTVTVTGPENETIYEGDVPESISLRRMKPLGTARRYRADFHHPDYQSRSVVLEPNRRWGPIILNLWLTNYISPITLSVDYFVGANARLRPSRIEEIELVPATDGEAIR